MGLDIIYVDNKIWGGFFIDHFKNSYITSFQQWYGKNWRNATFHENLATVYP